jgi:hypothetical protein
VSWRPGAAGDCWPAVCFCTRGVRATHARLAGAAEAETDDCLTRNPTQEKRKDVGREGRREWCGAAGADRHLGSLAGSLGTVQMVQHPACSWRNMHVPNHPTKNGRQGSPGITKPSTAIMCDRVKLCLAEHSRNSSAGAHTSRQYCIPTPACPTVGGLLNMHAVHPHPHPMG